MTARSFGRLKGWSQCKGLRARLAVAVLVTTPSRADETSISDDPAGSSAVAAAAPDTAIGVPGAAATPSAATGASTKRASPQPTRRDLTKRVAVSDARLARKLDLDAGQQEKCGIDWSGTQQHLYHQCAVRAGNVNGQFHRARDGQRDGSRGSLEQRDLHRELA